MTLNPYKIFHIFFTLVLVAFGSTQTFAAEVEPENFIGGFSLHNDDELTLKIEVLDTEKKTYSVIETLSGNSHIAYPLSKPLELAMSQLFTWRLDKLQQLQCISYANAGLEEYENEFFHKADSSQLSVMKSMFMVNPIQYQKIICHGTANQIRDLDYIPKNTNSTFLYYDSGWGLTTDVKHVK